MLGSAPATRDFASCFDHGDAVIPATGDRLEALLTALERQPERLTAASRAGVDSSLRRHDWAHRWQRMLDAVGLAPSGGLTARLDRLEAVRRAHADSQTAVDDVAPSG